MEIIDIIIIVLAALGLVWFAIVKIRESNIRSEITRAEDHGILIKGVHYSVWRVLRADSYTQGWLGTTANDATSYGELAIQNREEKDSKKQLISEDYFHYMITKAPEKWIIDYQHDEPFRGISYNGLII